MRRPELIDLQVKLVKVTVGAGHAIALSHSGKVFSWGLNVLGQLGLGNTDPRWSPTQILALKDTCIADIVSGAGHNFAIDRKSNTVYSWGASADFQTGVMVLPSGQAGQDTKQFLATPQRV